MLAAPENVRWIGQDLDRPEGVCVGPDGSVYAGGEEGQMYRITPEGRQEHVASTGGCLLGLALDGNGSVHACDVKRRAILRIDAEGGVVERSDGTPERRMQVPNYPVFDEAGNLYVSDSGDYWDRRGTGCVFVVRADNTTEVYHNGPFRFANGLAIDPSGQWLYVAQTPAWNVVRVPLGRTDGPIELTHQLPEHTAVDGLAFADDGRLVIACYRPDVVYVGYPDGRVEVLIEDPTGELLMRPTNAALHGGKLYLANLGGRHIAVIETDMRPGHVRRPTLA